MLPSIFGETLFDDFYLMMTFSVCLLGSDGILCLASGARTS